MFLNLVVFDPDHIHDDLIDEIPKLGECRQVHNGCFLLATFRSPLSIQEKLLPYIRKNGSLVVVKMYRNHCAGKLDEQCKRFLAEHICIDPTPQPKYETYSG